MKQSRLILTALAVLAAAGLAETTSYAQTGGMDRREDRRDNRDEEGREGRVQGRRREIPSRVSPGQA